MWRHLTFHPLSPTDPVTSFSRFNGFVSPANAPRMCRRRLVSWAWLPMGSWYFYISLELFRSAVKTGVSSTCFFIMFRFSGLTTLIRDFVHAKLWWEANLANVSRTWGRLLLGVPRMPNKDMFRLVSARVFRNFCFKRNRFPVPKQGLPSTTMFILMCSCVEHVGLVLFHVLQTSICQPMRTTGCFPVHVIM